MSSKDPKDNFKEVIDHFKKINQLTNDHPQATNDRPQSSEKIEEKDSKIPEKIEKKDLEYEAGRLNINLQKEICYWVRWVVSIYLAVVGFILLVLLFGEGNLDTSVIIALLTTTTINILGLPWLIIRSLFPPEKKSEEKKS